MDKLKLIAEIRQRQALWDLRMPHHYSRETVQKLWEEVSDSMGLDVTVDECKTAWKYLRDQYRAEVRRIEVRVKRDLSDGSYSANNSKYGSVWTYFKVMSFIKDLKRPRGQFSRAVPNNNNNSYDGDFKLNFQNFTNKYNSNHNDSQKKSQNELKSEPCMEGESDVNSNDNSGKLYNEVRYDQTHLDQSSNRMSQQNPTNDDFRDYHQYNENCPQNHSQNSLQLQNFNIHLNVPEPNPFQNENQSNDSQTLETIPSTCSAKNLSNLCHISEADYNFLISFLPYMTKMSELQNLEFRSKITHIALEIMSQSLCGGRRPSISSSLRDT